MPTVRNARGNRTNLTPTVIDEAVESGLEIPMVRDPQESTFLPPSVFVPIQKTRYTQDVDEYRSMVFRSIEPPPDYQADWQYLDIDNLSINSIETDKLLLVLKAISPAISKAHWDFQQFANNQCSWECTDLDGNPSDAGAAATEAFMERIAINQSSFSNVLDRLLSSAFLRGSYFFEMVLDNRVPIDLVVGDPALVRYRRQKSRRRGQYWQAGQLKKGEFYAFRHDTVVHAPVNSMVSTPYGIPLIDSSIFASIFQIGLLYDIRRVISNQGYYRLDFSLDWEVMEDKARRNQIKPGEVDSFIRKRLEEIRAYYDQLGPSDSLAHTSDIEIKDIGGALGTQALGSINAIIDWINNQLTLACKTIPILMGVNNSTSETHANRQWENYMATIRSCQRKLAEKLDFIFTLALRYQGIQGRVKFHFQELSLTTALNQAIYEQQKLSNIEKALNMHIKGMNAEGKEVILTPVPLMTADEALEEWQQTRNLR